MSDVRTGYSDFVRFSLKSENAPTYWMLEEPGGWNDDELELERHKDYHGIFTKFTNKLKFSGDAKDYIENAYILGGINTTLRLTKEITKEVDGEVKWVQRYSAIADYSTKTIKGNVLDIKFNSNDLAELIKSHEDDTFEIERIDSIDGYEFPDKLEIGKVEIKGRSLTGSGEQRVDLTTYKELPDGTKYQEVIINNEFNACKTEIVSAGGSRHDAVKINEFQEASPAFGDASDAMFFIDLTTDQGTANITFNYEFTVHLTKVNFIPTTSNIKCELVLYEWNGTGYDEVSVETIVDVDAVYNEWLTINRAGSKIFNNVPYNQGLMFRWNAIGDQKVEARFFKNTIVLTSVEFYEASPNLSFVFTHDLYERLMYIMTGEKNKFYSKFFGRIGLKDENGNELYTQDGLDENGNLGGGLIGLISGFWVRAFDPLSDKYKSLQISLADLIESCQAVFNIGVGIEIVDFKERLRVEELKYFYREKTIVKLPFQITNEKRTVDSKLFFSATEIGYKKGGDYENEIGLDEPNTKTEYITPVRKSKNKYKQLSEIRGDEYGMELTRRKPQFDFPDEDTSQDEHNWFLDLVRDDEIIENQFRQAEWDDRLDEIPQGIHSPTTFRSMIFTPLRILFRHGWILRAGIEPYLTKFVKYISSVANSNLKMKFPNEQEYSENSDILVGNLDRSRFLPEEIEFEHPVDDDLIDWIFGTTRVLVNGSYEDVPNYYFKMEWVNEFGIIERGYLRSLKPKGKGKWKFIKANENTI